MMFEEKGQELWKFRIVIESVKKAKSKSKSKSKVIYSRRKLVLL